MDAIPRIEPVSYTHLIAMFARLTGTELVTIGEDPTEADHQIFFMK